MAITIRTATADDLPSINAIYNYYVLTSTCTYQEEPSEAAERASWFAAHGPSHPVLVATDDGEVIGWGSLGPYRERSGYRFTVENSVYVRHDQQRRGVGRTLLVELIAQARRLGHHTIIAGVSSEQEASVRLHEQLGFVHVAQLREVGWKFGRWLDVLFLQLQLDALPR